VTKECERQQREEVASVKDGRRPEAAAQLPPEGLPRAPRLKCSGTTKTNGVPPWLLGTTNEDSPRLKCLATTRTNGDLHLHGPTLYTGLHSHGAEHSSKRGGRADDRGAGSSSNTRSTRPGHGTTTHGCPPGRSPTLDPNCPTSISMRSFGQTRPTYPCLPRPTTPGRPTFDAPRAQRTAVRDQAIATFPICLLARATHRHRQNHL